MCSRSGRLGPMSTATAERLSDRARQPISVRWDGTEYTSGDRERREWQAERPKREHQGQQARQAREAQGRRKRPGRRRRQNAERARQQRRRARQARQAHAAYQHAEARRVRRGQDADAKRRRREARRWHHHLGECAAWAFSAAMLGACAQSWARGVYYPLFWSRGVFPRFWWIDHLPAWDWQRQASSHLVETAANWTVLGREDVSFCLLVAVGLWAVYCWLAAAAAASKCVRKAAQQAAERRERLAAARKERERQQQERAAAERERARQERQARQEREDAARAARDALRASREAECLDEPPPVTAPHHKQWIAQNGLCAWCHKPMPADRSQLHSDHAVPKSKGGSDDDRNRLLMHASCNLSKGTRPLSSRTGDDLRLSYAARSTQQPE